MTETTRRFLFLQGPHGPFFYRLGQALRKTGADVWRVGFNAGDRAFWRHKPSYIPYAGPHDAWPKFFNHLVAEKSITDIVLYGDTRPIHADAITIAHDLGLRIHVFEEGYLRPYWVTYERDGSNGHSRLMDMTVAGMQRALSYRHDHPTPPAQWGDMRQHIFYGALYHWFVLFRNRAYPFHQRHRPLPLWHETLAYTRRLVLMPLLALDRIFATLRIRLGGHPYHLALLQLDHDANFRFHSPFENSAEFIKTTIQQFAEFAPHSHHLVFKAHPLENDRPPLRRIIRDTAQNANIAHRVHYVRGGKLAGLLHNARTAITVNSTAGQQALWRGIPLRVWGRAVYSQPEFAIDQPPAHFFTTPDLPDSAAYRSYRQFLLETSQIPGGYYSRRGRAQLLREVLPKILADHDPYHIYDDKSATTQPISRKNILPLDR